MSYINNIEKLGNRKMTFGTFSRSLMASSPYIQGRQNFQDMTRVCQQPVYYSGGWIDVKNNIVFNAGLFTAI